MLVLSFCAVIEFLLFTEQWRFHMKNAVVTKNYTSAFPDPITLTKNDIAVISHCDLEYPGWVWITHSSGKSGWAPQQIFSTLSSNEVICLEDYTAHELSVSYNEKITVMTSLNGWYWAHKLSGESGWVPEECVNLLGDFIDERSL